MGIREILQLKPIGVLPLTNFGGVAIMKIEHGIEDYIVSTENYGEGYIRPSKSKVRYNRKGEPYFMRYGRRYYLKEFMRA